MNKIGDGYRRLLGDYFPSTIIAHIPRIEYPWCSFVMLPTSAEATTVTYTYIQPFPSRGQVITMPPPVDGRLTGVCLSFVFSLCGIRFLSLLGKQKIGWQRDAQVSAAAMTHSELNRNIFDNTHDKKWGLVNEWMEKPNTDKTQRWFPPSGGKTKNPTILPAQKKGKEKDTIIRPHTRWGHQPSGCRTCSRDSSGC